MEMASQKQMAYINVLIKKNNAIARSKYAGLLKVPFRQPLQCYLTKEQARGTIKALKDIFLASATILSNTYGYNKFKFLPYNGGFRYVATF